MPLVSKVATPATELFVCSAVGEEGSVADAERVLRTQFHMEPSSQIFTEAWHKAFERKECICKEKNPGRCVMQVWKVFGLASSTAYKIDSPRYS
jgi:hypothetical protein